MYLYQISHIYLVDVESSTQKGKKKKRYWDLLDISTIENYLHTKLRQTPTGTLL